jgi:hypothetical protein
MDAGLKNIAVGKVGILAEKLLLRQNELRKPCTILET